LSMAGSREGLTGVGTNIVGHVAGDIKRERIKQEDTKNMKA